MSVLPRPRARAQGNLPWSISSEKLQDLFRDYNPLDVHVKTNMAGRSRGGFHGRLIV